MSTTPDESRPLVSVMTPTWQRHDELVDTIMNVRQQTYRPLEHIVISDGLDEELYARIERVMRSPRLPVPVYFAQLGRNWSSFLDDSFCAAPMTVGMLMASGAYQTWLADDERMRPDHIASLVAAIEADAADFAYSKVRMYRPGQHLEDGYDIGSAPASCGQITNVLYRAEVLKWGLYPFRAGLTSDWQCISRWLAFGARAAFVDRVTLSHRIDH